MIRFWHFYSCIKCLIRKKKTAFGRAQSCLIFQKLAEDVALSVSLHVILWLRPIDFIFPPSRICDSCVCLFRFFSYTDLPRGVGTTLLFLLFSVIMLPTVHTVPTFVKQLHKSAEIWSRYRRADPRSFYPDQKDMIVCVSPTP